MADDVNIVRPDAPRDVWQRGPLPQGSLAAARFLMDGPDMSDGERAVRREWWLSHGRATGCGFVDLYGDDGEMQCSKCMIDFRRMAATEISAALANVCRKLGERGAPNE